MPLSLLLLASPPPPAPVPAEVAQLTPDQVRGPSAEALFAQAQQRMAEGRPGEALRFLAEAMRRRPDWPAPGFAMARCLARLGQAEASARFLEDAWARGQRSLKAIEEEKDFDAIRTQPPFQAALARLQARASTPEDAGSWVFAQAQTTHRVRVLPGRIPAEGSARRPLVLVFHGAGGRPEDFLESAEGLSALGLTVALVPGPYAVQTERGLGFTHVRSADAAGRAQSEALGLAVLEAVQRQYPIDPRQVFALGFSQGGMVAYGLALHHGDRLRGAIPIGAWYPAGEVAATRSRLLVLHSPEDLSVPAARHDATVEALKRAGVEAEVRRYPGGHVVTGELLGQAAAWIREVTARD